MKKSIQDLVKGYNKSTVWCKILIFISLLLLLVFFFKGWKSIRRGKLEEGFEQNDSFLVKSGEHIYDNFYADIYDYLVFNNMKDDYEVGQIIQNTNPTSKSVILDIGCGTGHHVGMLGANGLKVIGIDKSPSMISKAKENYPQYDFQVTDAMKTDAFPAETFTHVLCLYFTIYYFRDKKLFFDNCFHWMMRGGYLVVHLVDRENFDPILPPGNPLLFVSPQRYAEKRITSTKLKFTDFAYSADFQLDEKNDTAKFVEKFKNDNGKTRKHEHTFYMPPIEDIINQAQAAGFIVESKIDLIQCQYEYQYLYVFIKPN